MSWSDDVKLCGIYEPLGAMNIPILGYIWLMAFFVYLDDDAAVSCSFR